MPYCLQPGCPVRVVRGYCRTHTHRDLHGTRTWYYKRQWKDLREQVCYDQAYACALCGHVSTDLDVDHIRKHHGDRTLFWDRANLQAICKPCHTRKTRGGA